MTQALTLLIDADDTLWENNIYFERAFDAFYDFLSHSTLTSMREHKGYLYLGGLENNRIGRIKLDGADESWRKSFNGYPLTTGCGDRILYLEPPNHRWRFESF